MRFTDKVVVITGAAQGIGRQTAEQAAAEGAALLLIDRSSYVHELAATLAQSGCLVLALEADLEAWESTEQAFAAGVAYFGRIDVLITLGAPSGRAPLPNISRSRLRKRSRCSPRCGLPRGAAMDAEAGQRQHRQHFVGGDGGSESVPYSAAKGGVNALTRSIAMEYSGSGIRINAVAPGGTEAPPRLTPRNEEQPSEQEKAWYQQVVDQTVASSLLHRYGTLAEQANAILFLASDEASYITGVTLPVAGGDLG